MGLRDNDGDGSDGDGSDNDRLIAIYRERGFMKLRSHWLEISK